MNRNRTNARQKKKQAIVQEAHESTVLIAEPGDMVIEDVNYVENDDDGSEFVWQWEKIDFPEMEEPVFPPLQSNLLKNGVGEMPVDYWLAMFTAENMEILTIETNRYLNSKARSTKPAVITEGEMRQFIGILIYMAIVKVPKLRNYFSGPLKQDVVRHTMKISRFEQILRSLHMNDNNLQPKRGDQNYDKLYKFRPLLKNFVKAFDRGAEHEPHVSVDEMLAPAKGCVPGRVYMPNKPHKRGFKLWSLAGAKSGYVKNFQMFGDNTLQHKVVESSIGSSGRVVLELAEKMPQGSHIYFDNYFASPLLAYKLKERGHDATCTLRGNRKAGAEKFLMTEKVMKKKGRGSVDFVSSNGVIVTQWYDRKLVTVASTKYATVPRDLVDRWSANKTSEIQIFRPFNVRMYNKGMGGVDLADQYLSNYRLGIKTMKWYKKMLYFFIDLSISNAFACYKADYSQSTLDFLSFKIEVARSLMTKNGLANPGNDKILIQPQQSIEFVPDDVRLDGLHHWPACVDGGKNSKIFGKHCKIRGCKGRTRSYCMKCQVFLCYTATKNCFLKWHTEQNRYRI